MPEPSILFTVTGVVIAGLVAWLAVVLKKSNEPWSRTVNPDMVVAEGAIPGDPPIEPPLVADAPKASDPAPEVTAPSGDPADATAEATAVAVKNEGDAKEAEKLPVPPEPEITTESKDEEKKSDA